MEYGEKIKDINEISDMREQKVMKFNDELNVDLQNTEEIINMNDTKKTMMKEINCYKEERYYFKKDTLD